MKTCQSNPKIEKLKRLLVTAIVILLMFAITAGAVFVPRPAAAGIMRYALIGAGISAASSYAKHRGESVSKGGTGAPSTARTSGDTCKAQLPMGVAPKFDNAKWNEGLTVLCFSEYTVAYSAKTRTPLWSAEFLTRERLDAARSVKRQNTFHEEERIRPGDRSMLKDYVRSGYDRGHMSPSGDASNPAAQNETFSLANMVPQEPNNNRHLWEGIESGSRNYAKKNGALHVITGPLFLGEKISFINNRVAVPTHLWKLVYDPVKKTGGVFFVQNSNTQDIGWKSIPDFEKISGYHFNLGNPALMTMPTPKQHF